MAVNGLHDGANFDTPAVPADYEKAVRDGEVVMSARARDEAHAAELEREMSSHGGRQIFR
jgi:hypothetical protein